MADELKSVAKGVVDDVVNGVANEMCKAKNNDVCSKSCKNRSLLCIFFTPCTY